MRYWAVVAIENLFVWSSDVSLSLLDDRDAKVRAAAIHASSLGDDSFPTLIDDEHARHARPADLPDVAHARVRQMLVDRVGAVDRDAGT